MNTLQTAGAAMDSADALKELIARQAVEIERLQGHIKHIGNDALRSEVERRGTVLLIAGLYPNCTKEDAKLHFAQVEDLQDEIERLTDALKDKTYDFDGMVIQRNDALARLAAMEKQEPVAWRYYVKAKGDGGYWQLDTNQSNITGELPLYASAGASHGPEVCFGTIPAGASPVGPSQQQPTSPDVKAALLFALWHHQGGSSKIGQPIRTALGIGVHDSLTPEQLEAAKRVQSALVAQPSQAGELSDGEIDEIATHYSPNSRQSFARAIIAAINAKARA